MDVHVLHVDFLLDLYLSLIHFLWILTLISLSESPTLSIEW